MSEHQSLLTLKVVPFLVSVNVPPTIQVAFDLNESGCTFHRSKRRSHKNSFARGSVGGEFNVVASTPGLIMMLFQSEPYVPIAVCLETPCMSCK